MGAASLAGGDWDLAAGKFFFALAQPDWRTGPKWAEGDGPTKPLNGVGGNCRGKGVCSDVAHVAEEGGNASNEGRVEMAAGAGPNGQTNHFKGSDGHGTYGKREKEDLRGPGKHRGCHVSCSRINLHPLHVLHPLHPLHALRPLDVPGPVDVLHLLHRLGFATRKLSKTVGGCAGRLRDGRECLKMSYNGTTT